MKKANKIKVDLRTNFRESARTFGRKISKAPKDLPNPNLSENATYIAKTRYAFRDEKGEPEESPRELFWRVAYYILPPTQFTYLAIRQATRKLTLAVLVSFIS